MDINNLNNPAISDLSTISNLSNTVNVEALQKTNNTELSNSFVVEDQSQKPRSDLSNALKDFIKDISQAQNTSSQLNSQSTILSELKSLANEITKSSTPEVVADNIQPEIQNLLETYNTNISSLKDLENGDSTVYFDGLLGARPISPSHIIAAGDAQVQALNQNLTASNKNIEDLEAEAKDTIGKEIERSAKEAPFQPINFGKETDDFSSNNINSVIGSVALSQANAIPANSPKLLA
jgi:hypothetical protein